MSVIQRAATILAVIIILTETHLGQSAPSVTAEPEYDLYMEPDPVHGWTSSMADVRISEVPGSTFGEGNVEVLHEGVWGYICVDGHWQDSGASVVCRQLGYHSGYVPEHGFPLRNIDRINASWLKYVWCNGDEDTVNDCMRSEWKRQTCTKQAAVKCCYNLNEKDCYEGGRTVTRANMIIAATVIGVIFIFLVISIRRHRRREALLRANARVHVVDTDFPDSSMTRRISLDVTAQDDPGAPPTYSSANQAYDNPYTTTDAPATLNNDGVVLPPSYDEVMRTAIPPKSQEQP